MLILDEPTSGLDLLIRREFLSNMVATAAEGRTILISSHQIAEVERVASHAAFLARGRLLLAGTLEELRGRLLRVSLRFKGEPPDADHLGTVLSATATGGSGRPPSSILIAVPSRRCGRLRASPTSPKPLSIWRRPIVPC